MKFTMHSNIVMYMQINLFNNSDAILNRDALCSIQGKEHYLQAAIVGGIQKQYCDERFLSYNRGKSITFLSILCHQFARMA